ncbi:TPA: transcriptional regulator, partial [Escherichia coli]|nr:transcriptional regulator [Escherichia coli]
MKRRLTPSEFDQAVKRLPRAMKARNIQIARAILVEGRKQAELVRETGLSRTAIAAVVRKIREAHETYGQPPEGWERIEVCL